MNEASRKNQTGPSPRRRAERRARQKRGRPVKGPLAGASAPVWERQLLQIELEMQNQELRRAQEAAQEALAEYLDLFDFAPIGYFELDDQGLICRANFAGAALLGLDRSLVVRRRFDRFVAPELRSAFARFAETVLAVKIKQACETELQRSGETRRHVLAEGMAAARFGQSSKWRLFLVDITARRQAEIAMEKARDELERGVHELSILVLELTRAEQQERSDLTRTLHENLQQLLVGARLHLECLRQQTGQGARREALKNVDDTLDQAIVSCRLLNSELSPPVLNEGGLGPALEWLSGTMHKTHGLTVHASGRDMDALKDERITGLLYQAVRELLLNVLKHAKVKTARLEWGLDRNGEARIVVQDEGVGFDVAQAKAREGLAGGMGLFGIRKRLELLGGRMVIASTLGKGSRFTLSVPIHGGNAC